MIRTILGFFGYCKIPKAAVMLSMSSEDILEALLKQCNEGKANSRTTVLVRLALDGQKALTQFLRSGKLLQ